ncbi:MAG: ATP-binding protein, partial [Chloroflexota bacterium]
MLTRLADHLNAARRRQFIGRTAEQTIFRAAVTHPELPFFFLYVFGPGGVGKTTLLGQYAAICEQTHTVALHLDARELDPTPATFIQAFQLSLGLSPAESPLEALATRAQRHVLFIDTFEKLKPLEGWLRHEFLPQLPENVLVVLAARHPPSPGWRAEPGWQALMRIMPLRNFSPDESLAYLNNRAVPADQHPAILNFTYGHPLALSLIADTFAQRGYLNFKPEASQDIIQPLLAQLVQKVPGPAHRAALEACALVRMTTEPLLAAMLTTTDAHELFDWLRGLSCIESGPSGLCPHDLARETLIADLHWRNPDWYTELHRRARIYYSRRLQQVPEHEQQAVLIDYIYLHRDNPVVRPFFVQLQSQWHDDEVSLMADQAVESDRAVLKRMVEQHEGAESAQLAQHWFNCQPASALVFRDASRRPVGLLAQVTLDRTNLESIGADPATTAAWLYLEKHSPLRPGEKATYFRFWLAHDSYQAVSAVQSL